MFDTFRLLIRNLITGLDTMLRFGHEALLRGHLGHIFYSSFYISVRLNDLTSMVRCLYLRYNLLYRIVGLVLMDLHQYKKTSSLLPCARFL